MMNKRRSDILLGDKIISEDQIKSLRCRFMRRFVCRRKGHDVYTFPTTGQRFCLRCELPLAKPGDRYY